MSWPPGEGANGGGGGSSRHSGKAIGLLLSEDLKVNLEQILEVPFDVQTFNDGFIWDADEKSVEVPYVGTILITCSAGAIVSPTAVNALSITALIFKNGLPLRQNSSQKVSSPYCTASASVMDKCQPGDKYVMYVTGKGGDDQTFDVSFENGLTGMEMSYL